MQDDLSLSLCLRMTLRSLNPFPSCVPLLICFLLNRQELPTPPLRHLLAAALLFLALALPSFFLIKTREPGSLRNFFLNENLGHFLTQSYGDRSGSGYKTFFGISCCWWLPLTFP